MKRIKKIGSISPTNEHQSGLVVGRGGYYQHSIQCSGKNRQRQYGKLIVLGGVGKNARRNRDESRVIDSVGICYTLKAHISKEAPLVLRNVKRYKNDRTNG